MITIDRELAATIRELAEWPVVDRPEYAPVNRIILAARAVDAELRRNAEFASPMLARPR